jgi:hypothetical protein
MGRLSFVSEGGNKRSMNERDPENINEKSENDSSWRIVSSLVTFSARKETMTHFLRLSISWLKLTTRLLSR